MHQSLPGYQPKHPEVYNFEQAWLAPELLDAMKKFHDGDSTWRQIFEDEGEGIFAIEIFTPKFCAKLLEEVNNIEEWCTKSSIGVCRPNSMNNYGLILSEFGFSPFLEKLRQHVVLPFASHLYPEVGGSTLDDHHGFIVEYDEAPNKDRKLSLHVDDSDVTLNICLGTQFEGGDLQFMGRRCRECIQTPPRFGEVIQLGHQVGTAVFHIGQHRHQALPITQGHRANLILWCRSSEFREMALSEAPSFCSECNGHSR